MTTSGGGLQSTAAADAGPARGRRRQPERRNAVARPAGTGAPVLALTVVCAMTPLGKKVWLAALT
ncbi:MAG: hypothetical protein LBK76_10430 [Verrucomicrobiales bacterium]|jgi:hypothetical protein|nr:hypothetical protein [Verrucomicrobiales bacterium]